MESHEDTQITTRVALLRDNWLEYFANADKSSLSRDVDRTLEYHTEVLSRNNRDLRQLKLV